MAVELLGRGVYDASELSWLLHVAPSTLARWTKGSKTKEPVVPPTSGNIFSFRDLVSLWVVRVLTRRGVPLDDIRVGVKTLQKQFDTPSPLAHEGVLNDLATSGRSLLANFGELVDAGKGGQGTFQQVIEPTLQRLEFDQSGMAVIWRPSKLVWLNPQVQAGTPCVDQRRIPTSLISGLIRRGEDPLDVAEDYELSREEVLAALDFERDVSTAGLAAA